MYVLMVCISIVQHKRVKIFHAVSLYFKVIGESLYVVPLQPLPTIAPSTRPRKPRLLALPVAVGRPS